jgi:hypothetical protein
MPDKSLTKRDDFASSQYPVLRADSMKQMLTVFRDNIGTARISTFELPRIKCPTGGETIWIVQTPEGTETTREIEGIVTAWKTGRAYWKTSIKAGGGNRPPDCSSNDSFYGKGDPGGKCEDCPFAQFGSAPEGGRGQACKQVRQMLYLRPGEILPYLISVPPTSLRNASQYFLGLVGRQIPYWGVTTKIRLESATNEAGKRYARMVFTVGRRLEGPEVTILKPYHEEMEQMLSPITIDTNDYTTVDTSTRQETLFEEEPARESREYSDGDIPY